MQQCKLPTIYSPEIRAFAGGDVSSKHFQTVLLSRRERHVTSLENLKFFRKDQQSTKDQQLLTFFCKDIVSCKSGNSSVWPRRSWKLASSVKTDPSVTLKKKASIRTQKKWLFVPPVEIPVQDNLKSSVCTWSCSPDLCWLLPCGPCLFLKGHFRSKKSHCRFVVFCCHLHLCY